MTDTPWDSATSDEILADVSKFFAKPDVLPELTFGNRTWQYSPLVHGWIIQETPEYQVAVCKLIYHFRVVIQKPNDDGWTHGWCYSGNGAYDLFHATVGAVAWHPDEDPEPWGWYKRACDCIRTV